MKRYHLLSALLITVAFNGYSQTTAKHEDTEFYTPVPEVVIPGKAIFSEPPADAIVLFNGKNLDKWVSSKDPSKPAVWTLNGNVVTVKKGTGNIQTKDAFTDYQLHLEFKIPRGITGKGQARGNSGLFLAAYGTGDGGYELQIMDSYNNPTYTNGQGGSIYKQHPPLANANRAPGEWQTYDVAWTAPKFNDDGSLKSAAKITAFLNGVLVQNGFELTGETVYVGKPGYKKHGALPIKLQDHGDPSEPISFRNIWIRNLAQY